MPYIGCHLSSAKGYEAMGRVALSIGANTFQFFTRNPRGSKAKTIDEQDIARFLELARNNGFGTLLAHALHAEPLFRRPRRRPFCSPGAERGSGTHGTSAGKSL